MAAPVVAAAQLQALQRFVPWYYSLLPPLRLLTALQCGCQCTPELRCLFGELCVWGGPLMHSQGGVHIPVRGIDRCWAEALCCDTRNCSQAPPAHCLVPAVVCVRPYPIPLYLLPHQGVPWAPCRTIDGSLPRTGDGRQVNAPPACGEEGGSCT